MALKTVIARLRNLKDDDLREAMENSPIYYDESDIVREALRQFFFGHTGREPLFRGEQLLYKIESNTSALPQPNETELESAHELEIVEIDDDDLESNLDKFIKNR